MKLERKDLKEAKLEFKISLTAQELASAQEQALKKIAKKTKAKGFREGKAPLGVVKQNTDQNVLSEHTLDTAVNQYLIQAFNEENITPLDQPSVTIDKFVPEQELEFRAVFEVLPQIKLPNYRKLKVKKEPVKVSDEDVSETLEHIQKSFAEEVEVDRDAKNGDRTTIDFKGFKDGEPFAGGESKDFPLELGSGKFIPGFEDQIVGHKAGEKFNITVTFPKDYGEKSLAGAEAKFEVELKKVVELKLPEINDELAKKTKMFKTLDELKADIKKNLLLSKEEASVEDFKNKLVEALAKNTKTVVPEVLKNDQVRAIEQEFRQNLSYRSVTLEQWLDSIGKNYNEWVESELNPAAETRVKAGLALSEVSKELEIIVEEPEIEEQLEKLKSQYGKDEATLKQLDSPRVRTDIRNTLVTQKTIEKLVEFNG